MKIYRDDELWEYVSEIVGHKTFHGYTITQGVAGVILRQPHQALILLDLIFYKQEKVKGEKNWPQVWSLELNKEEIVTCICRSEDGDTLFEQKLFYVADFEKLTLIKTGWVIDTPDELFGLGNP